VTSWDDEVLLRGDANSSIAQRETAREKRYLEEKRRKHRKNPQKKKSHYRKNTAGLISKSRRAGE
jgi:hypothetical protein